MIKDFIEYLIYFFKKFRFKLVLSSILSLLVAVFDGLGLTMFIPLLASINQREIEAAFPENETFQKMLELMDRFGFSFDFSSILTLIVIFFFLKAIVKFIEGFYKAYLQRIFIQQVRTDQVNLISNLQYAAFVKMDSGRIQNLVTTEVNKLISAFGNFYLTIQALIMGMAYVTLAMFFNFKFALIVMIGVLFSNIIYSYFYKITKNKSMILTELGNSFQKLLVQKVNNFKYLQASGSIKLVQKKLQTTIDSIEKNQIYLGFLGAFLNSIKEPLIIVIVSISIFIELKVFGGDISLVIISLLFFYRAMIYLINLQTHWNSFLSVSGAFTSINQFLIELKENGRIHSGTHVSGFTDKIVFDGVHFAYSEKEVLHQVNLEIKKNESIGIIGESGSGKTTLVNLLSGLMDPTFGRLTIDGKNLKDISKDDFQSSIGYITQEPVIFDDSVFNNVALWKPKTKENIDRFWEVVELVNLKEFINDLENREDTYLGYNGSLISGGQKQRFSIARELFKRPQILILDEATSALDSETESIINTSIQNLKNQCTLIIIAHRISSVKHVDKLVILENGRISLQGNFLELSNKSKYLKEILNLQRID
jgi:ABC-type multidrug transport system fused ATPase/permease subunit